MQFSRRYTLNIRSASFLVHSTGLLQTSALLSTSAIYKSPAHTNSLLHYPRANICRLLHSKHASLNGNFNLAKDIVQLHAQRNPNKPCLVFSNGLDYRQEISYRQLFDTCVQLATGLRHVSSAKTGTPAAPKLALVILPKVFSWWAFNVAASWSGTIISPGTSLLTENDVIYRMGASGADCVVCTSAHVCGVDRAQKDMGERGDTLLKVLVGNDAKAGSDWVRYEELLSLGNSLPPMECHANSPQDVCQLFFTSGTTGKPKMVPHTHLSYGRGQQITARTWLDLHESDVFWNVSDTGWAKAAWSSLYTPFIAGATAFVHQMERFDGLALLNALQDEDVSVICAPPTAYRALVQLPLHKYKFRSLRHCVSAGEPLNPEVIDIWKNKTGFPIHEGYGQSESTLMCAKMPGMEVRPGSMGKPAPGYRLKVVDDDLQELSHGQEGQIVVETEPTYPEGLFRGYKNDHEKTQASFKNGYYLTGDRGHRDSDGYLWFVARDDDVIISSGYRIGPFEVESALIEHPSVAEAAVVATKDHNRGHVVKAFIVLTNEASSSTQTEDESNKLVKELQDHVKRITAPYKYPRKIEFVTSLPKTVSGKIRRVELRQQNE